MKDEVKKMWCLKCKEDVNYGGWSDHCGATQCKVQMLKNTAKMMITTVTDKMMAPIHLDMTAPGSMMLYQRI